MSINISVMPYLYNNTVFDNIELVRAKLYKEIPMNKQLTKIADLNKIMKIALISNNNLPSIATISPEYFIIPCNKELIVDTYEDDEIIKFTIKNKRFGRFDSSFNVLVVYISDNKSVIPISLFVTEETVVFNKDEDREFTVELKKE